MVGQIKKLESRGGSLAEPAERTSGGEEAGSQGSMISERDNFVDKHRPSWITACKPTGEGIKVSIPIVFQATLFIQILTWK